MTILITGSSGKTASQLAQLLAPTHSIVVASRRPKENATYPSVRFDWLDESTYRLPFSHAAAEKCPIAAVYLVSPDVQDARARVMSFVKYAIDQGVRRFVLLSAWEIPEGGPFMGQAHAELKAMGKNGIEWTVLRPHFFMENFAESYHQVSIKSENKIYSAAGDGSKPFISARDIAAVARSALIDEKPHNTEYLLTGPVSLSYDQVASIFTTILERKIEHVRLSREDLEQKLLGWDLTDDMAAYMADLDITVSKGVGKEVTDNVQLVTGQPPRTFESFVTENRQLW